MHRYKVREIAQQAGLSEATVDRVLHNRPGVRANTREEVEQAIKDLDNQRSQLRLSGRSFLIDVVMQSPERFSSAFRAAVEAELPTLKPAVVRTRFHFRETGSAPAMVETLRKIAKKKSNGVIVKAPDAVEVSDAIDELADMGIPVVTFASDVPGSKRLGYIGIDNRAAGETAAYLIEQWLGETPGNVLITLSSSVFRGEDEREMGFRAALRRSAANGSPTRPVVEITESDGLDERIEQLAVHALEANPSLCAVYSAGGGNVAIVRAFERLGRHCRVFIAHDLDHDNRQLLRTGKISAVLHHDLRVDAHLACRMIMQAGGALSGVVIDSAAIRVITPHNIPW